jgi:chaperone required for assembly of F1-ATPase
MRDSSKNSAPENAMAAARRAMRPALRRRVYEKAAVTAVADGYALVLDGKPVRTPAGCVLAAPSAEFARALAAEWNAQGEMIDPTAMPLTQLANAIIDGVCDQPGPIAAEIEKYLASDLVCYRAGGPRGLVERQSRSWDPIVSWAREELGARFSLGDGVIAVVQPESTLAAANAAIPDDPWRLGAVHAVTTLTGSALIALALAHRRLGTEEAWQAAHIDEDWNTEQWGRDDLAMARRAFRHAEMQAAATVLAAINGR